MSLRRKIAEREQSEDSRRVNPGRRGQSENALKEKPKRSAKRLTQRIHSKMAPKARPSQMPIASVIADVAALMKRLAHCATVSGQDKRRLTAAFAHLAHAFPAVVEPGEWKRLHSELNEVLQRDATALPSVAGAGGDASRVRVTIAGHSSTPRLAVGCDRPPEQACAVPTPRVARAVEAARNAIHPEGPQIAITTRHATRLAGPAECADCRGILKVGWQYQTNSGPVILCGLCRDRALDRAFGHHDALDVAVSGGRFDSNRRRH
jgi:hypothetical protein